MLLKNYLISLFSKAMIYNKYNILTLIPSNPLYKFLDLGCDDGEWTMQIAKKLGTNQIYGIEIVEERIKIAKSRGIIVERSDLNNNFNFPDNMFDLVHANQVIEHIINPDIFVSEIYRILKPDGYAIISTENASSWHNIFAAIMGWQIFSLTNVSYKLKGLGNPLAIHQGNRDSLPSWTHKIIFNYFGLISLFHAYKFKNICVKGSGYHPLPARFGNLDKRHCHFITIRVQK
jgi:ubiquinone/menaquinone biosynthesis C-methylase UbiE